MTLNETQESGGLAPVKAMLVAAVVAGLCSLVTMFVPFIQLLLGLLFAGWLVVLGIGFMLRPGAFLLAAVIGLICVIVTWGVWIGVQMGTNGLMQLLSPGGFQEVLATIRAQASLGLGVARGSTDMSLDGDTLKNVWLFETVMWFLMPLIGAFFGRKV